MTNNEAIPLTGGTSHISRIRVIQLPDLDWLDNSARELGRFSQGQLMVERSDPVYVYWTERPLLVAGLYRPSLVSIPYLWVLLTKEIERAKPSVLRAVRKEIGEFAPLQTLIEVGQEKAHRLAKALGLHPQGRWITMNDTQYEVYGRSVWHS